MRVLYFAGEFAWKKNEQHTGLVYFCHVEVGDNTFVRRKFRQAVKRQNKEKKKIILVPFAHLDCQKAENSVAADFFHFILQDLREYFEVVMVPFGVEKELHLSVSSGSNNVKFIHFNQKNKTHDVYEECASEYDNHMRETGHYAAQAEIAQKLHRNWKHICKEISSMSPVVRDFFFLK